MTVPDPATPPVTPEPVTPPVGEAPPASPPVEPPVAKPEDDLPEWARKELTNVRGEAANYRTKLREAETKLSNAKTVEEFEAATAALKTENETLARNLMVTTVAAKYELPTELAEVLKGTTEAELETHAKQLQKFAAAPDPDLDGGLTPGSTRTTNDPRELAKLHGGRRR